MAIYYVEIENFTVFKNLRVDFSKGINVIVGENGTGKTHLLKLLYGNHHTNVIENANIGQYFFGFEQNKLPDGKYRIAENEDLNGNIIYIPPKDMLTHSRGFMSLYDNRKIAFDKTYFDIVSKALLPDVRVVPAAAEAILPILERILEGRVVVENDIFYIEKTNGSRIEFSFEAEGLKKIGLLWQLLMNESITEDTVLLWDEPEANLNPKLIPEIVDILFELSRRGVQVFAATHDYILAKYFEVKKRESDSLLFHSLYKEGTSVVCESGESFSDLKNNSIVAAFNVLMDEVIGRNLGE